jgi:molecular chaperone GrpE
MIMSDDKNLVKESEKQEDPGVDPVDAAEEQQEPSAEEVIAELNDKILRAAAELENLRKRHQKDLENARKYGSEGILGSLVPVRDSLDLAMQSSEKEMPDSLKEGLEATLKLFDSCLENFGVESINPKGRIFDPNLHEAMVMQVDDSKEEGTIVEVIQKGFKLHDRVLRAARVIVSKKS